MSGKLVGVCVTSVNTIYFIFLMSSVSGGKRSSKNTVGNQCQLPLPIPPPTHTHLRAAHYSHMHTRPSLLRLATPTLHTFSLPPGMLVLEAVLTPSPWLRLHQFAYTGFTDSPGSRVKGGGGRFIARKWWAAADCSKRLHETEMLVLVAYT